MITTERFWQKVRQDGRCWIWTGAADRNGYGLWTPPKGSGLRMGMAHRFSFIDAKGPVPIGLELDHLCRTHACVKPSHLEAVTHAENMRRYSEAVTECPQGHPYDEGNTYVRASGYRRCRACAREAARVRQGYYEGRSA